MIIEVINTGSELLLGQVLNTHLGYFSEQLLPLGVRVTRADTVPDGPLIEQSIRESMSRADVVLVTGGLGPTSDDLTRDIISRMFNAPLEFHPEILDKIYTYFAQRKVVPGPLTRVQAFVPQGATVLPNNHGSAPGLYLQRDGKHLFCLPGPPRELKPMFEDYALPILRELFAGIPPLARKVLRVYGVGESLLQERVEHHILAISDQIEIGYCARLGEVDLRFIAANGELVKQASAKARELLGEAIYAEDEGNMEQTVISAARAKHKTIATAESCTGGLVAHRLTNIPGSSAVLQRGWVTYSNQSKVDEIGVSEETLRLHGAVSAECAREMARGALAVSGCDLAVALTGIAGPDGGTAEKPVGTLYAGLAWKDAKDEVQVESHHKLLVPKRDDFKLTASQFALNLLRLKLS
ncbi:MAG: competence/damage-inducible protein A [Verrucomicrobiales bacterium]|jgi:nicotinamide-nucleotide amidase|nr:competence/damage-inducible protein A [Verrucomicrobiales bacterium]